MTLYEIRPDDEGWGRRNNYLINASHKWKLPGVSCSVCKSTWGIAGEAYPAIDLSALPNQEFYKDCSPISLERLEELRRPIRSLAGADISFSPGTEFGPLVGKAY